MAHGCALGRQIYGKTHYHLEGPSYAQELVVFIHGVGDYGYRFEPMANAMNQAGYRTLRFDIFGRGFSDHPGDCRFDVDMYVGHVQSLLQRLQLADMPVILVGHSMGGQVVRPVDTLLRVATAAGTALDVDKPRCPPLVSLAAPAPKSGAGILRALSGSREQSCPTGACGRDGVVQAPVLLQLDTAVFPAGVLPHAVPGVLHVQRQAR
eukprot:COSAG02_NODE_7532_length_2971_cov_1.966574_3_plen_208_part_00